MAEESKSCGGSSEDEEGVTEVVKAVGQIRSEGVAEEVKLMK